MGLIGGRTFEDAAFEAEFVPTLEHPGTVVEVVVAVRVKGDFEDAVFGGDGVGVVPLVKSDSFSGHGGSRYKPRDLALRRWQPVSIFIRAGATCELTSEYQLPPYPQVSQIPLAPLPATSTTHQYGSSPG